MGNFNFRTDMADERVDTYKQVHNLSEIEGIKIETVTDDIMNITTVDVLNDAGKIAVQKDIGKYITMELKELEYLTEEQKQKVTLSLAEQIKKLIGKEANSFMIVGLGNGKVTPDSLGPKVVSGINVTRHMLMYAKEYVEPGTKEISAISPGVLGTTGIETEEIVESVTKFVKPDVLIVIDSLASMSVSRVGKTIQLGNTGITPGAGVGNKRRTLNKENLGMQVIAIGVPTVVDLGTIVNEGLDIFIGKLQEKAKSNEYLNRLKEQDNYEEIKEALTTPNNYNMIVTPKEIDDLIENMKDVIARRNKLRSIKQKIIKMLYLKYFCDISYL